MHLYCILQMGKYLDQLCESGSYGACAAWIFRLAFFCKMNAKTANFNRNSGKYWHMRQIVYFKISCIHSKFINSSGGLGGMMHHIVNHNLRKGIDEIISVLHTIHRRTYFLSCNTIKLSKSPRTKKSWWELKSIWINQIYSYTINVLLSHTWVKNSRVGQ